MKFLLIFLLVFAQLAQAGSPVIWGPNRGQNLTSLGFLLSDLSTLDNDGLLNYIKNGNAEVSTSGWITYADAAGTTPVDCTGGAPTETFTRSASSPLINTASFVVTKDAANRQGQGASYAFTIDAGYASSTLSVYLTGLSGGTYSAGDLGVYLYDVTGTTIISPTIINLATSGVFNATFATTANTSYRLCLHTQTSSASAYTYKVDGVYVGTLGPASFASPMTTRGDMIRQGAAAPERFAAVTNNRVVRGNGTDVVSGQIDATGFFTSGAAADASNAGIVSIADQFFAGLKHFNSGLAPVCNNNTSSGTVTLTISDNPCQVFTAASAVKLPTTSVLNRAIYYMRNAQSSDVDVEASDASVIVTIRTGYAQLEANQATPVSNGNWEQIAIHSKGSFTGTLTATSGASGSVKFDRVNNIVNLDIPDIEGTSTANTLTMTGLPGTITPPSTKTVSAPVIVDAGVNSNTSTQVTINSSSVLTFFKTFSSTGFTPTGTKGVNANSFTYNLQ